MNIEQATWPIFRPFEKWLKSRGDNALSLTLIFIAVFFIWVALKRNNVAIKAVLLTWILLP